ncbi:MAG: hypothetical protein FJY67_04800 [Calditrichaeota bacterium]|nr:hypothetical protein [Calditrichota bacterium]
MNALRKRLAREDGWTFIEATLAVVIMSVMVLGLTIVMLAFREHLDRSWAVRSMDQYGNDVLENLTHDLRNAVDIEVAGGDNSPYHRVQVKFLNPYSHDRFDYNNWRVDTRSNRVIVNNRELQPYFPPRNLRRGESYVIEQFTLTPYGKETLFAKPEGWERADALRRDPKFTNAAYEIRFKIRYNRNAMYTDDVNWSYTREYFNRVYLRNKNLIVKKGITD